MGKIFDNCLKNTELADIPMEDVIAMIVNGYSFNDWLDELKNYKYLIPEVYLDIQGKDFSFWGMMGAILKECIKREILGEEIPDIRGER